MKGIISKNQLYKRIFALCLVVNLLLFFFVLFFFKPLYNSGDDAILMYSFSGSFGIPPTELVDYSWGWHFLFGLLIKKLFVAVPSFNWYSFFLLAIHFLSCVLVFDFFLRMFRPGFAFLLYAVFFIFFEVTCLFSLNFTNTSIICAAAGNVLLVDRFFRKDLKASLFILPSLVLLVSGLLRLHAWLFVELIFGLFIFLLPPKKSVPYLFFKSGLLALLLVCFLIHQEYYKKRIPGWERQQYVSGTLINFNNSPHRQGSTSGVFKDSVEEEFFKRGFYYDSLLFTDQRIKEITSRLKRVIDFSQDNDWSVIYWTFVNTRIYLLCILITVLFLFAKKEFSLLKKSSIFLISSFLLYMYLMIFKKVTGSMFIGLIATNWLIITLLYSTVERATSSKRTYLIFIPLLVFCFFWMSIRIYKMNSGNIKKFNRWICCFNDLRKNFSTIHIASDKSFPIDYFSVIDNPQNFEINNFISVGQFPKTVYYQKRHQLELRNIPEDILKRHDLAIVGVTLNSLNEYYLKKYNQTTFLSGDTAHYRCVNAYRVLLK